jgi:hypothetical protein
MRRLIMSGRGSEKSSGAGGSDLLELHDRCPCRTEQRALPFARVLSDHVVSETQTHGELRSHLRGRDVSIQDTHRATTQDVNVPGCIRWGRPRDLLCIRPKQER